jgi:ATP-dependent protease ClpP protease subunit
MRRTRAVIAGICTAVLVTLIGLACSTGSPMHRAGLYSKHGSLRVVLHL